MTNMNMPGFSAKASLYRTSQQHYRLVGTLTAVPSGREVLAQLRPSPAYGRCLQACNDRICAFDDIGDLCRACKIMCLKYYGAPAGSF
jgi:hypothetical protein